MGVTPLIEDSLVIHSPAQNRYELSKSQLLANTRQDEISLETSLDTLKYNSDPSRSTLFNHLSCENRLFVYFDYLLTGSCFSCDDAIMDKGLSYNFFTQQDSYVEVEVRATLVAPVSQAIDRERYDYPLEESQNMSHFVGRVRQSNGTSFKEGDPVTSMIKCPVQSRSVKIPPKLLIPLPATLDAGEAAALVSTYLPAFGALHHGSPKQKKRFSKRCLKGCNVLVTGGGTQEANATVKLALLSGASRVFLLASERTKNAYHVGSHRVLVLNDDPAEWFPRLEQEIDIVIDMSYPKNFDKLKASLVEKGRYVAVVPSRNSDNFLASFVRTALFATSGILMYDFDEVCENCYEDLLRDLYFLCRQLVKRKIRPSVDKYIKMKDVPIVQEDMRRQPVVGAVVCEPWRR